MDEMFGEQDLGEQARSVRDQFRQLVDKERIIVQPSCSLLHVPVTKETETKLDPIIKDGTYLLQMKSWMKLLSLQKGLQNGKE